MRYLLDTHALLWWMEDSPRMPQAVKSLISSYDSVIVLSAASAWEIAIKVGKKKLTLQEDPVALGIECGFSRLDVIMEHAEVVKSLPHHHGDPFDRMLIAQAIAENLTLITSDTRIRQYDVPTLWDDA